jgi:uncharacterized membrane protein HdeD (DUF308 family)
MNIILYAIGESIDRLIYEYYARQSQLALVFIIVAIVIAIILALMGKKGACIIWLIAGTIFWLCGGFMWLASLFMPKTGSYSLWELLLR